MPDILDLHPMLVQPEPNTGCWLCISNNNQYGYARLRVDGRMIALHRLSYIMSIGPIPQDMEIDHRCRISCCVNPQHLEAVTQFENKRRAHRARVIDRGFRCANGHELSPENLYSRPSEIAKGWEAVKRGAKKAAVLAAIQSGYCNTSVDVADETGLPVKICSVAILNLVRQGHLRRNGRTIPGDYRNRPAKVFEVIQ